MKKGHFDSKKGGNGFFFQKTETKSWSLPLMNGGLKITNPMWNLKQTLKISLVHKGDRTSQPLEIDWLKIQESKQKTPRGVIRAVV